MTSLRLLALGLLLAQPVHGQAPRLGTIDFPTSVRGQAQDQFLRGVLYLHSFEYDAAANAFREAQRLSPGFAMAAWGEAMTYNHPVWDQQDRAAALAALTRLGGSPEERARKAPTERERAWLHAVEVLYGAGSKIQRDTVYSAAMEEIARRWPGDLEAQTFYALSLMGMSQTTRVVPAYMRAGAIALAAMEKNSDHPGAAHYVIHAFDDPVHAPIGLPAARAYSRIAPGAAHAQHMTTHIFLALGMWNEVVSQNVIASGEDRAAWKPGHYTAWLGYGLLQQGRMNEARKHLELVRSHMTADEPAPRRGSLMMMRAAHLINAESWPDTSLLFRIDPAGVNPAITSADAFAVGFARYQRHEMSSAAEHLASITHAPVLRLELEGLLTLARGDTARALTILEQATAIEDTLPMAFGPPDIVKPSHELLGEVFMELQRPADAKREFLRALALAPGRMRALLGLRRAATAEGDVVVAGRALAQLREVLAKADSGLVELSGLQ
jgi:tetratricopeptide (TPR) repeat protein